MSKKKSYLIIRELFYAISLGLALFAALELAKPGLVIAYLDLNYWLIFWLVCGSLTMILRTKTK